MSLTSHFLFLSCVNILEKEPEDFSIEEKAINSVTEARIALNGCYSGLQEVGYYGRNIIIIGDLLADNTKLSPNNSDKFISIYNHSYTANDDEFKELWASCFKVINRANNIINSLQYINNGIEDEKNQIYAEALCLRALANFDLLKCFAYPYQMTEMVDSANGNGGHLGIPIIKDKTDAQNPQKPSRETVKFSYSQIINDLKKADSLFITEFESPYFFSRLNAKALLSRIYLYKNDFINAFNCAVDVISSNRFELTANENYIESWGKEYTKESLLSVAMLKNDYKGTNSLGYIFLRNGYNDIIPSSDLTSLYKEADVRSLIIDKGTEIKKYPGREETPGLDNVPVIRYSEIFLILAEAAAKYDLAYNSEYYHGIAITALDSIRKRANPQAPPTIVRGEDLLDAIYLERRKEFAFEGHRFFDLKRNLLPLSRNDCNAIVCHMPFPSKHFILPIPQKEINANENIIQNFGY